MNPKKAIKILDDLLKRTDPELAGDNYEAIKLGIEALKRVKSERTGYETYAPDLLPGETEE